ncbi:MAG: N-formylglutamate amidohydrolase [Kordiimonadaceae bacterium]|nr:N-formylglutamate amidohydrolase [Kordiimonadaceae bacterium]
MDEQNTPPPYIHRVATGPSSPFIFAAPHSGRYYPADFKARSVLTENTLRKSEDAFVDKLFADVSAQRASLLIATHARAYLDLNRAENELDPKLFTPQLASETVNISHRVQAGLGIIPQFVAENTPIYASLLPAREAEKRIKAIHGPYHRKLAHLLNKNLTTHGAAILIDCHSMPSDSLTGGSKIKQTPDIILGDCWGTSCRADLTDLAETLLLSAGFNVRRNVPYSGGFSTAFYGEPEAGIHALQIEINRSLYMDEATLRPLPAFDAVQQKLAIFSQHLIATMTKRIKRAAIGSLAAE